MLFPKLCQTPLDYFGTLASSEEMENIQYLRDIQASQLPVREKEFHLLAISKKLARLLQAHNLSSFIMQNAGKFIVINSLLP